MNADQPLDITFPDKVKNAVAGMYYLSENEAPVELIEWPEIRDQQGFQQMITDSMKLPASSQTIIPESEFMAPIHRMAVPEDPRDAGLQRAVGGLIQPAAF